MKDRRREILEELASNIMRITKEVEKKLKEIPIGQDEISKAITQALAELSKLDKEVGVEEIYKIIYEIAHGWFITENTAKDLA